MRRNFRVLLVFVLLLQCIRPAAAENECKYIALTFDDGPSAELTPLLLDGLAECGAKATFFVCACHVRQSPALLERMQREGHEIGMHSCCHDYMHRMTKAEILDDLTECRIAVTEACGVTPTLFRPPGGLYSDILLRTARKEGLSVILWSVDTRDWNAAERTCVLPRILSGAAPGAVVLMHELHESSVRAALAAVRQLQAQGCEFVTVSGLAQRCGTELVPGNVYSSFPH